MDMCFGHQMPWLGQSVGIPASKGEDKGFSCLVIKVEKDISHQREEHLDLTAPSPVSQPAVHLHCKFSGQEVVQLVFPVFWYFTPTDPPPTRAFKLPPNCLWEIPSNFSPLLVIWRQLLPNVLIPLMKRSWTGFAQVWWPCCWLDDGTEFLANTASPTQCTLPTGKYQHVPTKRNSEAP